MPPSRKRRLKRPAKQPKPAETSRPLAVIDMGASAIRLVVAEAPEGEPLKILEEASRGVLLGKDTFARGRLAAPTIEATIKILEGFRRIMDTYGVVPYRAVATSAVREAQNRETFLDRVQLRTGIDVEIIDGSEENRLTYIAVREALRGHEALTSGDALLVEVGGGSADISFLRRGAPLMSGTYALGSIRMLQGLASWHGSHEQRMRLLRRHIQNVVGDIRRDLPLREVRHVIAPGGDVRFAAAQILGEEIPWGGFSGIPRGGFLAFCDQIVSEDVEQLMEHHHLAQADAETLVPALLAYRELLMETAADRVLVPRASLRAGLLLDLTNRHEGVGLDVFRKQVLASATTFGEKYRCDTNHARRVAFLAGRIFDELRREHGLGDHERLLLEVAAHLHDVGLYINQRAHHKHSHYILTVSDIFGLSRDELAIVANVSRYHRRAMPQKAHASYMSLDSQARVVVNKLAAILRVANALDADHLQKVSDLKLLTEEDPWVLEVEAAGDLTMERLATRARADLMTEVFGRKLSLREAVPEQ